MLRLELICVIFCYNFIVVLIKILRQLLNSETTGARAINFWGGVRVERDACQVCKIVLKFQDGRHLLFVKAFRQVCHIQSSPIHKMAWDIVEWRSTWPWTTLYLRHTFVVVVIRSKGINSKVTWRSNHHTYFISETTASIAFRFCKMRVCVTLTNFHYKT